jgi:peptidoglycan/xylan/chitin deacetylase (PgdA/CDA1 family)
MQQGIFTISLDFELFWGVRDHRTIDSYGQNIKRVHEVVPILLQLFEKYQIHCTWATVGFLYYINKEILLENILMHKPNYKNASYNQYNYINNSILEPAYHFAPDLINQIKTVQGQELGTHTFSHYYCLEQGADTISFNSDLEKANEVAKLFNVRNKSIVFPRNQYNEEMLEICKQNGISVYRGTENSWIYKTRSRHDETLWRRMFRLLDVYISISGNNVHNIVTKDGLTNIPSSRFLRPFSRKLQWLDFLKLRRIKRAMTAAAKQHKIFHLWWHPHNFGSNMKQNLAFLCKILEHYNTLKKEYNFTSLNMFEIASQSK